MFEQIKKSNLLFAIVLFLFVFILGFWADRNLYRYKYYDETNSHYEFGEKTGDIQTEYAVNFPFKLQLIDLNGLVRKIAGQKEMNGVVKLNNGYLTEVSPAMSDEFVEKNTAPIIEYNNYCKANGITLYYVSPPYKISKYDDELPVGVIDGHNDTLDRMLSRLEESDVKVLDLRESMHDDGINQYDLFYRTDHHWTTEGGFYGYQKIAAMISEDTGTYLDEALLDINNYEIDTYRRWHLGTRGQRTGALFGGIDDFDLIYPKFDTQICNLKDGTVSSVKDALVKHEVFENRNRQDRYTYDSAYDLNDINLLFSPDAKTDLSVLLLGDSFYQAVKQYMLLTYREFYCGEYRKLTTSDIEKYNPDVVIILAWPGYFGTDGKYFKFIDNAE